MTKYQCPICNKRACDSNKHLSIEKARPSNEANADIIIKCQCCKSILAVNVNTDILTIEHMTS